MPQTWAIFQNTLALTSERYNLLLHSLVLMSNHFHLILSTPSENIDRAMRYFLTETSRKIARGSKRINHVYGSRYKWSLLPNPVAQAYCYKYVYRNPVRAGICKRVEEYPFSTINCEKNSSLPLCELLDWGVFPPTPQQRLNWLNEPTPKEQEKLIAFALRRKNFAFSKDKKVQLKVRKLSSLYLPPRILYSIGDS